MDQNPMFLPPGTQLEEFEIDRVLGAGGFGITYLAHDTRLGRQVVIKENFPRECCSRNTTSRIVHAITTRADDVEDFEVMRQRFEREAGIIASLDHPGIVRILRSFEAYGTAYFVMPFVEGESLDELLKQRTARQEPFTEKELRDLLTQILGALEHLHARDIYHRDIKPANILMTREKGPVLIDFGAARQITHERSMTMMESAGYTPFEQLQSNGKVGPWSDLYALAATLVKLITGERPPTATDRLPEDPWMPLALRGEISADFSLPFLAALDRAFANLPQKRWQHSREWLRALDGSSGHVDKAIAIPDPNGTRPHIQLANAKPLSTSPRQPPPSPQPPPPPPPDPKIAAPVAKAPEPAVAAPKPAPVVPVMSPEEIEVLRVVRERERKIFQRKARKFAKQASIVLGVVVACAVAIMVILGMQGQTQINSDAHQAMMEEDVLPELPTARRAPKEQPMVDRGPTEPKPLRFAAVAFDPDQKSTWQPAAESGCREAAEALGLAHLHGRHGFAESPRQAYDYLRMAASTERPTAALALAMALESGRHVTKDEREAIRYYEMAALQGNNTARLNLGIMHAQGRGTEPNDQLAVYYYLAAANDGDRDAQYLLGMMFDHGLGTVRNLEFARAWYTKSAAQGDADAKRRLTELGPP